MKYIIDTHIFLWLLFEPKKIPDNIVQLLRDATNHVAITSISFWEISLKYNLGKLELYGVLPDELLKLAQKMGLDVEDIGAGEMASFYKLPKHDKHKDPFDRIVIWYCINSEATLVSCDGKFEEYESDGLRVLR